MKKVVIWIALSLWSVMTVFAGETAYLFLILSMTVKTDCI